jgi:hypothetical protein
MSKKTAKSERNKKVKNLLELFQGQRLPQDKRTLYLGLDDHENGSGKYKALVVSSLDGLFGRESEFSNHRDQNGIYELLEHYPVEYRYLIADHGQVPRDSNNLLVYLGASLIFGISDSLSNDYERLRIFIDGRLNRAGKDVLIEQLRKRGYTGKISISGHIKNISRRTRSWKSITYRQPIILAVADYLAYHVFMGKIRDSNRFKVEYKP